MKNLLMVFLILLVSAATAQEVWLSVSDGGYMTLNWKADKPGPKDYVALYDDDPNKKGPKGHLTNQWHMASTASSYVTNTGEGFFYYIAYIQDDGTNNPRIRSVAGPANCINGNIGGNDYLHQLNQCLVARYGTRHSGNAFALTTDNTLKTGWIAQTPNVWGKSANEVKPDAGRYIANDIKSLISQAEHFIDITTLAQFPDGAFQTAILEGLTNVAKSGRDVTVRILAGFPILSSTFEGVKSYLDVYSDPISKIPNNKLKIYVAAQRTSPISWNHAKMVAVDGKAVLLGGENQWTKDYLGTTPVHDLNVIVHGPAAYYCHQFADLLWQGVCTYKYTDPIWMPWSWGAGDWIDHRSCLEKIDFNKPKGDGNVSVLGVGRLGQTPHPAPPIQPSDYLMALILNSATTSIRIAQQNLAFRIKGPALYWDDGMKAIANAITRKCDVYIVLSNDDSKGGSNPYSMVSAKTTADKLRWYVQQQSGLDGEALNNLLCEKLHFTTLRFGPSNTWPGGGAFANHAKFMMVDDKVFYVGSANIYPSNLQEYGVFIGDSTAVSQMKSEYYDKLWTYSGEVAISGNGVQNCYFKQ